MHTLVEKKTLHNRWAENFFSKQSWDTHSNSNSNHFISWWGGDKYQGNESAVSKFYNPEICQFFSGRVKTLSFLLLGLQGHNHSLPPASIQHMTNAYFQVWSSQDDVMQNIFPAPWPRVSLYWAHGWSVKRLLQLCVRTDQRVCCFLPTWLVSPGIILSPYV